MHYLETANAATQRSNTDTVTNSYGPKLIQFCKNMNLVIINGRCGKDKNIGKPTCKDVSVVDYMITSPELLRHIDNFEINDFDPLLSDVHCAIHTKLVFMPKLNSAENPVKPNNDDANNNMDTAPSKPSWKNENKEQDLANLTITDFSPINELLHNLEHSDEINHLVSEISTLLKDTATRSGTTFKAHKKAHDKKKYKRYNKPWFDSDCSGKRKHYFKCKNNYRRRGTNENKDIMNSAGRLYKKAINKAFKNTKMIW